MSQYVDGSGAAAYEKFGHGPDGELYLDPRLREHIAEHSDDQEVIDIGCGAGPFAIRAVQAGATSVYALDNSEPMLAKAGDAVATKPVDVREKIALELADAYAIPKADRTFDTAYSLNVGCALPDLLAHFQEMRRVLRQDGKGIITAPVSLELPFTTFGHEEEKIEELRGVLDELAGEEENEMKKVIGAQADILRATIVQDDRQWRLVEASGSLALGEAIFRKIPGLVVPNYFHTSGKYEETITGSGLTILETTRLRMPKDQYTEQTGLGSQYMKHNPFDVYLVRRQAA